MRRPTGPATAARLAAVFGRALAAAGLCPRTDRLALAVSGGADSVALAALAAQWSESGEWWEGRGRGRPGARPNAAA